MMGASDKPVAGKALGLGSVAVGRGCGLGGEPAEEHRKRALELCDGTTLGMEMVQVSCLSSAWNGVQGLGRGEEEPSSQQAGLGRSQGHIWLTLMNKWHSSHCLSTFESRQIICGI